MKEREEWDEFHRSEKPAYELLRDHLRYEFLEGEPGDKFFDPKNAVLLELERESPKQVVLVDRLVAAIKRINPWIDDENGAKVVRRLTNVLATGLMEANAKVWTDLVQNVTVEQDLG